MGKFKRLKKEDGGEEQVEEGVEEEEKVTSLLPKADTHPVDVQGLCKMLNQSSINWFAVDPPKVSPLLHALHAQHTALFITIQTNHAHTHVNKQNTLSVCI